MKFKNQKEMFNYIWETREHKSEISGLPLFHEKHFQHHWQFLHILPKGTYPKWKLNPDNIMLGTVEEHENQEQYEVFKERQSELKREYYREFYNRKD